MRIASLPTRTWFTGILGITVGGFGCSSSPEGGSTPSGSGGASASTSGSGQLAAGGSLAAGGHVATGGLNGSSGGSANTGGSPSAGGTLVNAGGNSTGVSATGGASKGGAATGGVATGGAAKGGADKGGASNGNDSAGGAATGGTTNAGPPTGGTSNASTATGGANKGGSSGGASKGGSAGLGAGGSAKGGATGARGGSSGTSTGTCTASTNTGKTVTGTGPHKVVIETNSANGIKCGTIYRPADLGGTEKYPIFVWGEGGCAQDGLSNQAAMGEIASWGYFIIADGTPGATGACTGGQNSTVFLDYLTWAIAENANSCSAYYQSLETTKIAADGFSCGGLMSENVAGDPRFSAIGITSSGQMSDNTALYAKFHTPFKVMNGGSSDIAYENGLRDYQKISALGIPSVYFSKTSANHGGDLSQARGDFNMVNLAWLNWQLKGDEGATGKGFLYGSTCKFCTDSGWTYSSANIQ